jgi:hypothetical protein
LPVNLNPGDLIPRSPAVPIIDSDPAGRIRGILCEECWAKVPDLERERPDRPYFKRQLPFQIKWRMKFSPKWTDMSHGIVRDGGTGTPDSTPHAGGPQGASQNILPASVPSPSRRIR